MMMVMVAVLAVVDVEVAAVVMAHSRTILAVMK